MSVLNNTGKCFNAIMTAIMITLTPHNTIYLYLNILNFFIDVYIDTATVVVFAQSCGRTYLYYL